MQTEQNVFDWAWNTSCFCPLIFFLAWRTDLLLIFVGENLWLNFLFSFCFSKIFFFIFRVCSGYEKKKYSNCVLCINWKKHFCKYSYRKLKLAKFVKYKWNTRRNIYKNVPTSSNQSNSKNFIFTLYCFTFINIIMIWYSGIVLVTQGMW